MKEIVARGMVDGALLVNGHLPTAGEGEGGMVVMMGWMATSG